MPLGYVTRVTQHLPGGLPQTIVDPNGVITRMTYDARLRLIDPRDRYGIRPADNNLQLRQGR